MRARRLPVAFIGNDLKQQFFPNVDAVGKQIEIDGRPSRLSAWRKRKARYSANRVITSSPSLRRRFSKCTARGKGLDIMPWR